MPASTRPIPDTPTPTILRAALLRAKAVAPRARPLAQIVRALGPHRSSAEVDTALDALVGDGDATEAPSGSFKLTNQGLVKARQHPAPRYRSSQ